MAKVSSEMLVITKVYDLVVWSSNHIARFPCMHRFTLGDRLQACLYELLEMLLRAKYTRERLNLLRQADLELELLRLQFRIAKDLRCLPINSLQHPYRGAIFVGAILVASPQDGSATG